MFNFKDISLEKQKQIQKECHELPNNAAPFDFIIISILKATGMDLMLGAVSNKKIYLNGDPIN